MECGLENILVPKKVFPFQSKKPKSQKAKKTYYLSANPKKNSLSFQKILLFLKFNYKPIVLSFALSSSIHIRKKTFPRERSRIAFPSLPHHHLKRRVESHRHICHPLFLRYFRAIPNHAEGLRVHPFHWFRNNNVQGPQTYALVQPVEGPTGHEGELQTYLPPSLPKV